MIADWSYGFDDETDEVTAKGYRGQGLRGVLVTCPNGECENKFRHNPKAISPSGQCSRCGCKYYILTDGTIVDDAGMDQIHEQMATCPPG